MSDTKLMNYITTDFQTKSDMKVGEIEWKNIKINGDNIEINKNYYVESNEIL